MTPPPPLTSHRGGGVIRLGVTGVRGRMGTAILALAAESKDFKIAGGFEKPGHPDMGEPIRGLLNILVDLKMKLEPVSTEALKRLDVLIDFSEPQASLRASEFAAKARCGLVIGTTGFSKKETAKIRDAAKRIPIVLSPNMSVGANLLFEIARETAKRLDDSYDVEIVEAHHRMKKDAPSGTARKLAETIASARGWTLDQTAVYGRKGLTGPRRQKEIGIHVIRAGEIVGDHTAIFSGPGETIELTHHAFSRNAFAKGALLAARFVARKKKGLFTMSNVLSETLFHPWGGGHPRGGK